MASVPFQTDYARPSSLTSAKLGASQRARQTAAVTASGSVAANSFDGIDVDSLTGDEYLDKLEEKVNKSIDEDLESLIDGFRQLVMLASIKDKDKVLIAQDAFQSDLKADSMVRSAQSLSLLSSSVSLSLLLAKSPDPSLDDEARQLIQETEQEKKRCRELINLLGGMDESAFEESHDGEDGEEEEEEDREVTEEGNTTKPQDGDPKERQIGDDDLRISNEKEDQTSAKDSSQEKPEEQSQGPVVGEEEDEEMEDVEM